MLSAKRISLALLALTTSGCALTESRNNLAAFDFTEVVGETVEPALDATGAGRQVIFLGQTPTPTRCYDLRADLSVSGNDITLTVNARVTNPTCAVGTGSFRYQGSIEMVRGGVYHFIVKHVFPSNTMPTTTLTKDIVVQ